MRERETTTGTIKANGMDLEYETFGQRRDPPILLIMGLGAQMLWWPEDFCELLAQKGFYAIRFDNRDIGKSTWLDDTPVPDIMQMFQDALAGKRVPPPYTLEDMAADAMALLRALGIERAHVVGASMGGMIAQICAANYPDRVLSLTSIMSTSGRRDLPQATPEVLSLLTMPPPDPTDRAAVIEHGVRLIQTISGDGYTASRERAQRLAERSYDRGYHAAGTLRQFAAIIASGNRTRLLETIHVPTLVIHGDRDPLIPPEGGKDTAAHIPGAKLVMMHGMGHDLPPELLPQLTDAIAAHCRGGG